MTCEECYWYHRAKCNNKKSEYYNQPLSEKEPENGCKEGETQQAVDYRNMTAWEFASKYYG